MKTIQNLFFEINSKTQIEAAKNFCESPSTQIFNPRMTINASRRFLVLEFPEYSGHDKHKQKEALQLLFLAGGLFGCQLSIEIETANLSTEN